MRMIQICMGSSCHSRGNAKARQIIEDFLDSNGLRGCVDFRGMLCVGECGSGPNIIIDGTVHRRVDEGVLLDILRDAFAYEIGEV